jgi:predicted DNA-binding transcriptional regulator YafY
MRSKRRGASALAVKRDESSGPGADTRHGYGYCRFAAERMLRMHRLIEDRGYPNSSTLAREFEVSVRTIKRDVDFMKTRLNLPIAFDVPRNGYYFTEPVPHFPQMPMSEKEAFALFVAQKAEWDE